MGKAFSPETRPASPTPASWITGVDWGFLKAFCSPKENQEVPGVELCTDSFSSQIMSLLFFWNIVKEGLKEILGISSWWSFFNVEGNRRGQEEGIPIPFPLIAGALGHDLLNFNMIHLYKI